MKGRIIKIEEIEKEESKERIIIIRIFDPHLPYTPLNYQKDWEENRESFGKYNLKFFERYEKELKEYHKVMDEIERIHIGEVELKQD